MDPGDNSSETKPGSSPVDLISDACSIEINPGGANSVEIEQDANTDADVEAADDADAKADADAESVEMDPMLLNAAARGNIHLFRRLLARKGGRLTSTNFKTHDTALHVALRQGRPCFAGWFKSRVIGRWPQVLVLPNARGDTPLHCALKGGVPEFVVDCVREPRVCEIAAPDCLDQVNAAGYSLVYLAAGRGQQKAVKHLLGSPFGTDISGPGEATALHAAVQFPAILLMLLRHHPQRRHDRDAKGNSPLHYAVMCDNIRACAILSRGSSKSLFAHNNDGFSPLHLAAILGEARSFNRLLRIFPESVWEVTAVEKKNVLHLAVKHESLKIVGFLASQPKYSELMYEADISGNTPLHLAASKGNGMLLGLLSTAGVAHSSISHRTGMDVIEILAKERKMRATARAIARRRNGNEMASTQLVVAGLIIGATYTIGFQAPNGYKKDELASRLFVLFNGLAFGSSFYAAALLFSHSLQLNPSKKDHARLSAWYFSAVSAIFMMGSFIVGTSLMTTGSTSTSTTSVIYSFLGFTIFVWLVRLVVYPLRRHVHSVPVKRGIDFWLDYTNEE